MNHQLRVNSKLLRSLEILKSFTQQNLLIAHPATWLEGKVGGGGDLFKSARLGRSTDQKPCTRSDLVQCRHGDDHAQGVTLGKDIISNRVQDDNLGQDWTVTNLWQGTGMAPACSGSDRGSRCCVFTSSQQFSDVTNVCKLVQGTTNPPPFQNAPGPHILVSHNIKLETDYNGGFFRV